MSVQTKVVLEPAAQEFADATSTPPLGSSVAPNACANAFAAAGVATSSTRPTVGENQGQGRRLALRPRSFQADESAPAARRRAPGSAATGELGFDRAPVEPIAPVVKQFASEIEPQTPARDETRASFQAIGALLRCARLAKVAGMISRSNAASSDTPVAGPD